MQPSPTHTHRPRRREPVAARMRDESVATKASDGGPPTADETRAHKQGRARFRDVGFGEPVDNLRDRRKPTVAIHRNILCDVDRPKGPRLGTRMVWVETMPPLKSTKRMFPAKVPLMFSARRLSRRQHTESRPCWRECP